jgi:hypothetical protein
VKTSTASFGRLTIGYPWWLCEVFKITALPLLLREERNEPMVVGTPFTIHGLRPHGQVVRISPNPKVLDSLGARESENHVGRFHVPWDCE